MNQVKRFIKWCIDNDIAFTHIDEAVEAFKNQEEVVRIDPPNTGVPLVYPCWDEDNSMISNGSTSCDETFKFTAILNGGKQE